MANISYELAQIMSAVFGRDVRQSIHDGIDKVNRVSEVQLSAGTDIDSASSPTTDGAGHTLYYDGSLYININDWELWKCTGINSWVSLGIFRGEDGEDGNGIANISGPVPDSTNPLIDVYTIIYTDGRTKEFSVTNGKDGADGKDGSVWYKGTALTGTGSGYTGFPGKEHDFYLNSTDGYVYTCTKTGGALPPDAATWDWILTLTGGGGVAAIDVIDNLNQTVYVSTEALSARQGYILNQKKIEKPASPNAGDVLLFDGSDWESGPAPSGGHTMNPLPSSNPTEKDVVSAVVSRFNSPTNDEVPSLYGMGHWSNNVKKRYFCPTSGTGSIGNNGIGDWPADPWNPTAAEYATWWYNSGFIFVEPVTPVGNENPKNEGWYVPATRGYVPTTDTSVVTGTTYYKDINSDDLDVRILFDNRYETIALGGYRLDTARGLMCIRFANRIIHPELARVAVDITYTRTEINS